MKYALGRRVFTAQQPDYRGRVERLRRLLKKRRCSALLVTDINNIRYLTGFTGSNAQVVLTEKKGLFLTDSRYSTQAASEVREGFRVRVYRKKPLDALAMSLSGLGLSCVGFVETGLSFGSYVKLKKALRPVRLRPLPDLVGEIRAVKEPSEVESIRRAVLVLELAFKKIERVLKPGMTEKEAAFLAEVEESEDVRVRQRRHRLRLALEAPAQAGVVGEAIGQDLERDVSSETAVSRAVDLSHPSGAEGSQDLVRPEAGAGGQGHGRRCWRGC